MKGYFITGTDTNVGKTHVACALARRSLARGLRVFAFKPVETGCAAGPGAELIGSDQELLSVAAGDWQKGTLRGLYRLPLPAAPLVAAEAQGLTLDLDLMVRTAQQGAAAAAMTLVEGAGGWRVPITQTASMSTLARALDLPVIIVARATLGTINHTLLTLEAVERDGLSIAAVIMSQRREDDPVAAASNRIQVARRWPGRILMLSTLEPILDPLFDEVPRGTTWSECGMLPQEP